MSLLPEGIAELDLNNRRNVEECLRLIEEVACGLQAAGTGAPGMKEAEERMLRAAERGDREAKDVAIADRMRAGVWEGWQEFPERQLLTALYQRAARRRGRTWLSQQ